MWMSRVNGQVEVDEEGWCGTMQQKCDGQEDVDCAGSWSQHR